MRNILAICLICASFALSAQKFYATSSLFTMNASAETCKLFAKSANAVAAFDLVDGKFEHRINVDRMESINDSILTILQKDFFRIDSFPAIKLNAQVQDFVPLMADRNKYIVQLLGDIELNGIKRNIAFEGELQRRGIQVSIEYKLYIGLDQFKLKAPKDIAKCISPIMLIKGKAHLTDIIKD